VTLKILCSLGTAPEGRRFSQLDVVALRRGRGAEPTAETAFAASISPVTATVTGLGRNGSNGLARIFVMKEAGVPETAGAARSGAPIPAGSGSGALSSTTSPPIWRRSLPTGVADCGTQI
jgi:hypothetical protein